MEIAGAVPPGGPIAVCGDEEGGDAWWFVYTDGLCHSPDGGAHMTKIMDAGRTLASARTAARDALHERSFMNAVVR